MVITGNTYTQRVYRHFAREALPEVKRVLSLLSFSLQLQGQSFELGAAVLQLLVVVGALKTHRNIYHETCHVVFQTGSDSVDLIKRNVQTLKNLSSQSNLLCNT